MALEDPEGVISLEERTDGENIKKQHKICKELKYYYKHREEVLGKIHQKKMEDPEYKAKYEERQRRKAEREQLEKRRTEKRELRKKRMEQVLNPTPIPSG